MLSCQSSEFRDNINYYYYYACATIPQFRDQTSGFPRQNPLMRCVPKHSSSPVQRLAYKSHGSPTLDFPSNRWDIIIPWSRWPRLNNIIIVITWATSWFSSCSPGRQLYMSDILCTSLHPNNLFGCSTTLNSGS